VAAADGDGGAVCVCVGGWRAGGNNDASESQSSGEIILAVVPFERVAHS
jgi:hypothetical protein